MMNHGEMNFDGAFSAGLPPLNYDSLMSLQNQTNQNNQNF